MAQSRLWVAGDSFGLFDQDDSRPNWIRMVADQLGVDEIKNYSRGGADNDMIYFVADSIIKNWNWPGRKEMLFNKETDYLIYLSTTNTRGWFRESITDDRPYNHENSIANFNWWMNKTNGKRIEEYELFDEPIIHSQNYNSLLHAREESKYLSGNNVDLVNHGDPMALKDDRSRVSQEVLDIMANYILLQDVDLTRKLNNTRMEHLMSYHVANGYKTLFAHHDMNPVIVDYDILNKYTVFEHPTDWDHYNDGDGVSEQPNHLTDEGHNSFYNEYLKQRVDDIINTWGWK